MSTLLRSRLIILSATRWPLVVSWASYTAPIPPFPRRRTSRYLSLTISPTNGVVELYGNGGRARNVTAGHGVRPRKGRLGLRPWGPPGTLFLHRRRQARADPARSRGRTSVPGRFPGRG